MADLNENETDRRLMEALQSVEVPVGLHARLHQSLQIVADDLELQDAAVVSRDTVASDTEDQRTAGGDLDFRSIKIRPSKLWNRRNAIGAAFAAGISGALFGYRQLTQPLSQSWLIKSTQSLLAQVDYAQWHDFDEREAVAVKQALQDVGFLRQVHRIALVRTCELQPPRDVRSAIAYDLGNDLRLLDLVIERGVQGVTQSLTDLPWSRSDAVAMAMSSGNRTLVFTGPASIHGHILRPRTT